jgi:hypothetical protein
MEAEGTTFKSAPLFSSQSVGWQDKKARVVVYYINHVADAWSVQPARVIQ